MKYSRKRTMCEKEWDFWIMWLVQKIVRSWRNKLLIKKKTKISKKYIYLKNKKKRKKEKKEKRKKSQFS